MRPTYLSSAPTTGLRADSPSCQHEQELSDTRVALAQARDKIENLEIALATGRKIGTAIGIVMATYKVTEEAAFDLLVMSSQRTHQKLREIALRVIDTGDLGYWADVVP